jgi:Tc5 transposase DNA-binding domain
MARKLSKADTYYRLSALTIAKEELTIRYILDLDARGFSPRRADIKDMANLLMTCRGTRRVGKCWTNRFIQRCLELCTRFSRLYNY